MLLYGDLHDGGDRQDLSAFGRMPDLSIHGVVGGDESDSNPLATARPTGRGQEAGRVIDGAIDPVVPDRVGGRPP
jgi:hypothetical protein